MSLLCILIFILIHLFLSIRYPSWWEPSVWLFTSSAYTEHSSSCCQPIDFCMQTSDTYDWSCWHQCSLSGIWSYPKKFVDSWNVHIPLTFVTDNRCLLKDKQMAASSQDILSINNITSHIITTSKPLLDDGELDWHQVWHCLLKQSFSARRISIVGNSLYLYTQQRKISRALATLSCIWHWNSQEIYTISNWPIYLLYWHLEWLGNLLHSQESSIISSFRFGA